MINRKRIISVLIVIMLIILLSSCNKIPYSREVARPDEVFVSDIESVNSINLITNSIITSSSNSNDLNLIRDGSKETYWQSDSNSNQYIEINLNEDKDINTIILKEKGNYISSFHFVKWENDNWVEFYRQDKIEYYRYCSFPTVNTNRIRIYFNTSDRDIRISEVEIYNQVKRVREDKFRVTAYHSIDDVITAREMEDTSYLDVVTDLIFFLFVFWDRDGNLVYGQRNTNNEFVINDDEQFFADSIDETRDLIGDRDVKICVNILNGTHMNVMTQESTVYSLTHKQDILINNIYSLVNKYNIDGVDFDWEYPSNPSEWQLYGDFFVNLKAVLAPSDKYLTVALSNFNVFFKPQHIAAIDYVQVMGYDRFDSDGNHSSFRSGAYAPMKYFLDIGFKREQLLSGLPYYGRPDDRSEVWTNYNSDNYHPFTYWDNYADYTDINGTHKSYFNGAAMVYDKTSFCIEQDFAGIMIFRLYLDLPYSDERCLTKAIGRAIADRLA